MLLGAQRKEHLFELNIELSSGCLPGQRGASISGRGQNRYKGTEAKECRELSLKACIYLAQGWNSGMGRVLSSQLSTC